jgi:hypothetical protein
LRALVVDALVVDALVVDALVVDALWWTAPERGRVML